MSTTPHSPRSTGQEPCFEVAVTQGPRPRSGTDPWGSARGATRSLGQSFPTDLAIPLHGGGHEADQLGSPGDLALGRHVDVRNLVDRAAAPGRPGDLLAGLRPGAGGLDHRLGQDRRRHDRARSSAALPGSVKTRPAGASRQVPAGSSRVPSTPQRFRAEVAAASGTDHGGGRSRERHRRPGRWASLCVCTHPGRPLSPATRRPWQRLTWSEGCPYGRTAARPL